jgi:Carboxypeptidase regulatory-like domain
VPPTNPPPLFSWEVYPLVYPPLPALRVPSRSIGRLAAVALLACTLLLVGVAGALGYSGAVALGPTRFALSGTVQSTDAAVPIAGADVVLTSEAGNVERTVSDASGRFALTGISSGGATLNVSRAGYASASYELFFSPAYSATGAGAGGLVVSLPPGTTGNVTVVSESPFGTLESFVSSLWSAGALLALAAVVCGFGAWAAFRDRHAPLAIAGGLGAASAPFVLTTLGVTSAFPLSTAPAAVLILLGLVGAVLELWPLLWAGRAAESG